jgi:putative Holliday junction resolvase
MRIMGLDYGSKTVGCCDKRPAWDYSPGNRDHPSGRMRTNFGKTYASIEELIQQYEVTEIVVGLPKNMNDTDRGTRTAFGQNSGTRLIRSTGLPDDLCGMSG